MLESLVNTWSIPCFHNVNILVFPGQEAASFSRVRKHPGLPGQGSPA